MPDAFNGRLPGLGAPAQNGFAVVPNDGSDLAMTTRALWVGASGDLAVILAGDTVAVTLKGAYGLLPLRVKRVLATGTTAASIVGLY